MPVITLPTEEGSAMVVETDGINPRTFANRFSWSSVLAGASVATATTLFLLALGAGFGLSLTSVKATTAPVFLTLGAIYFLTAQAFGFAAGGHLAGRLIGPASETAEEEEFRAAAHGLVVWALTIVATAALISVGGIIASGSVITAAVGTSKTDTAQNSPLTDSYVVYWVDLLFRPGPNPSQATLVWRRYAQADTGTGNDASPFQAAPMSTNTQAPPPLTSSGAPQSQTPQPTATSPTSIRPPTPSQPSAPSLTPAVTPPRIPHDQLIAPTSTTFTAPASLPTDKAEASRIIEVGMTNGMRLNAYDKARISALVAQDTGISAPEAQRRVDNAETRIYNNELQTADIARKIASRVSLWISASLLFGAIVAAMAAVSARWEDDKVTFGWPRREPE